MPAKAWSTVQTRVTALVLAAAALAVFELVMSRSSETRRIDAYLATDAKEHAGLLDRTLELEGRSLATFARDYTNWGEMVQFVQTGDPTWAAVNIDEAISTYQANATWVFDTTGVLVYAAHDSATEALIKPLPSGLSVKDVFGDSHFCHFFIAGPDGPVEIRGATIHPSDDPERKTPVHGYFLVARLWNGQYLAELARLTGKDVMIEPARAGAEPSAEIVRQTGEIKFIRPLPGPQGIPELTLTASLQPGWTAVALHSGRGLLMLQIALALLGVLGLTLVLWLWVTRPLNRIRRSLESGSTEALKPLEHNRTEFGQLAQLVGQFFGQNAALVKEVTERKQAEAELADQAERTKVLFEHAPDAYYLCDFHGTFLDGNRAAEELLGYPREELVGASFLKLNLLPASELAKAAGLLVRSALGQATGPDELELRRKDGSMVSVEINTHVVAIHGRKVVLGTARDITERKRAESALRTVQQRREQLDNIVSRSPAVAFLWRTDERLTVDFVSSNVGQLGYEPEEFLSGRLRYADIVHYEDRDHAIAEAARHVAAGTSEFVQEYRVLTKPGGMRWVEDHTWVPRDSDGRITHHQGIIVDITERKQAEAALAESELKYRRVFEGSNDAMMLLSSEKFLDCNDATLRVFGYSTRDEFMGKHPGEVSPPFQADGRESRLAADENIAAAFRDGRNFFEWLHQRADGAVFPADVLLTPLDYRGRRVLQATVRDITPRKIAEAEIAQKNVELAKLNALKNQFLGMAAHDLRNPLTVVNTASSFLLDDASRLLSAEQKHDFIRRINANGEFMLKLINDLLDVAKIESGRLDLELAIGDLCGLIEENLTMNRILAEKKSIRLDFTPERGLPPLRFDRGKVEQILNNLISNALKFSAPGTAVTVQASRVNGSVVVSVRDQGQGIPAEELDKLFKPFGKTTVRSTAGERSTGLGLAICRKIIEGHGGRIWAESEVGKGSIFSFSLPVANDESQTSDLKSKAKKNESAAS
jgi:PAS domain S-box-containing protein